MEKSEFQKAVGKRLRELRGGLTQGTVIERLGQVIGSDRLKTKEAYQHYESGRRMPPSDILFGLSQVFNANPTWIWTGKGSKYLSEEEQKKADAAEPAASYTALSPTQTELTYINKLVEILRGDNGLAKLAVKSNIDLAHQSYQTKRTVNAKYVKELIKTTR